jgi:D-glycero-D-manno-heptose 1,7-bisphosphate phosphatase
MPKREPRAVFLDRDGVINRTVFRDGKPRSPSLASELEYFPGVPEAVRSLRGAGFLAIVVTNQPDVARGWLALAEVEAMNRRVREELEVDGLKVCFHVEKDCCECRKPKPGMLLEAAREHGIDLSASYMVGDRYGDVKAGATAGCRTILVGPGDAQGDAPTPDARVESLAEAAQWILGQEIG